MFSVFTPFFSSITNEPYRARNSSLGVQSSVNLKPILFPKATDRECAELMAFLSAQQIPIMRLERHEADLEDLFMEVIGK